MRLDEIRNKDTDQILQHLIEKRCSNILKIYQSEHKCFFRGINSRNPYILGKSPEYRPPKDSRMYVQLIIDTKLRDYGFKALRSNSIFASSDYSFTHQFKGLYGDIFIVFPLNGFDFTTSNYYKDFAEDAIYDAGGPEEFFVRNEYALENKFVKEYRFQNTDILTPLKNGHEILFHGKYVMVNTKTFPTFLNEFLGLQGDDVL
jgi:hypothetical protein